MRTNAISSALSRLQASWPSDESPKLDAMLAHGTDLIRPIGIGAHVIRMACLSRTLLKGQVTAYLRGIRIGECDLTGSFEPGDLIEFPISYLPWVDLPAEIRFVDAGGLEIAAPFALTSPAQAIALVGLGDIKIEGLSIDQGVVRGIAVNRVNGLLKPEMYARINGVVPRTVTVEAPRLLDDGGASSVFAVRLDPVDLGENGLTVDLFVIGAEAPIASIAYRRADLDDMAKRVTALEARLGQIREATGYQFNTLDGEVSARITMLQERIDTFIEYAASFLFDRLAASEEPAVPGAPPASAAQNAKARQFLHMVHEAAEAETVGEPADPGFAVPLASSAFSSGWHPVEGEGEREFRWMGTEAVVFNPHPDRPVREIAITVSGVYGARVPMLRCYFDGQPARLVRDHRPGPDGIIRLMARWEGGHAPQPCAALRIESLVGANVAALGWGERHLSVAVAGVLFHYQDAPKRAADATPSSTAA